MQSNPTFKIKNDFNDILTSLDLEEMNSIKKEDLSNLLEVLSKKQLNLDTVANIDESLDYFNDMGFMQAIDIITAIEAVRIILNENNLKCNERKVIGYGHSHGAY